MSTYLYTAFIKKGNPHSKAHCSKVNWFECLHVAYKLRATHPLSIGTLLASCMSRMNEYIAIEDDNVKFHFLQVLLKLDESFIAKQCNGVAAEICIISYAM